MLVLLSDSTGAELRVSRDRSPAHTFQGTADLPAIDIQIGEDDPIDDQVQGLWRSDVRINVDLYVHEGSDDQVSKAMLLLRKESYIALMVDMPALSGVANAMRIIPGGAEEIERGREGSLPLAYCRTVFFVTYQHSLTDPSQ